MDTQSAIAELKKTMAAPTKEVSCVLLRASGETQEVTIDHRKVNEVLGGVPTVVGGARALDVLAVALRDQKKGKVTKHKLPDTFDEKIKGDIVLLRTDEASEPMPFTVKEYKEWVDAGFPDDAEQEEDEGEELLSDDEGEEGESGEEEDDEVPAEEMFNQLPEAELRKGCKMMGLESTGTREEMIARLVEATEAQGEESDDEEASGEEDEEESGEEDEADAETMAAAIEEQVRSLNKAQLKEACEQMGLSTEGDRDALAARVLEHRDKDSDSDDDDDEEEEEEEEEVKEAAPLSAKAGGKAKAKAVTPATAAGPKKTIVKSKRA